MKEKNNKVPAVLKEFDVIVIGAGHAGCEAALAAARTQSKTLLITISLDSIGLMSCNGAIGGPGRGQLVREIDALGGEIARNTDRNYIHSRVINISKGPALRTIRALVDKKRYFLSMKQILENQENLHLKQGLVTAIKADGNNYKVYLSDESLYEGRSLVISTGTFLRGRIFWGNYEVQAGRQGEINSIKLALSLERLGYRFGKLRTETPPRIDKKTVNFSAVKEQRYDEFPEMFSYDNYSDGRPQLINYITYIDKGCINYISKNISKSTVYGKKMESESPKYCPSIEDKIQRFAARERHLVFIQPEGMDTNEMYLHGLFTTFPEDVQEGIIRRINGLENAVMTRPGYGVEYDYLSPFQIKNNLESKRHSKLFFAGQINGSTGYEEAAAQGIIAGFNASLASKNRKSLIISREDGYTGILIDDLVNKEITEPYRMLTSRNEFRLFHRHDNSDLRMINFLKQLGRIKKAEMIESKYKKIDYAFKNIKKSKYYRDKKILEDIKQDRLDKKYEDFIKNDFNLNSKEYESLIISLKYEIYLNREKERVERLKTLSDINIPAGIDFEKVKNLSKEAVLKLSGNKPQTIGNASRLEGVRPTDILSLIAYIENVSRETL